VPFVWDGLSISFQSLHWTDAFATAASLKLIIGQLPALLGIQGVSNMDSSYIVLANVIRHISEISVDAAFGTI
jgi:sodium-independent sulfate anion transporter 11